uniref:Uncharacterized protein n=1 Tax=Rhodopseudomonas palustris (strain ATCC BAA-98 / CGA009) TaxID=258594 RepID=Q6N790_RHOPA|nr:hypothetical protein RPA2369a [Rhodopseudomonas palustris CGA009]
MSRPGAPVVPIAASAIGFHRGRTAMMATAPTTGVTITTGTMTTTRPMTTLRPPTTGHGTIEPGAPRAGPIRQAVLIGTPLLDDGL